MLTFQTPVDCKFVVFKREGVLKLNSDGISVKGVMIKLYIIFTYKIAYFDKCGYLSNK